MFRGKNDFTLGSQASAMADGNVSGYHLTSGTKIPIGHFEAFWRLHFGNNE